jgi:hypothetical protein
VRIQAVVSGTQASNVPPVDLSVPAEVGQPGFYDGSVQMPAYGTWAATLTVRGPAGSGTATFPLPYPAPPGLDSPLWWLAALPVLVAGAVLFYFWRVLPPAPPASEPAAAVEPEHHTDGQQH